MVALKLIQVGNSVGVVLPKKVRDKLRVEKGDVIYLTEAPDGLRITPYAPDFEEQMKVARAVMKKHRAALRELAK